LRQGIGCGKLAAVLGGVVSDERPARPACVNILGPQTMAHATGQRVTIRQARFDKTHDMYT